LNETTNADGAHRSVNARKHFGVRRSRSVTRDGSASAASGAELILWAGISSAGR